MSVKMNVKMSGFEHDRCMRFKPSSVSLGVSLQIYKMDKTMINGLWMISIRFTLLSTIIRDSSR